MSLEQIMEEERLARLETFNLLEGMMSQFFVAEKALGEGWINWKILCYGYLIGQGMDIQTAADKIKNFFEGGSFSKMTPAEALQELKKINPAAAEEVEKEQKEKIQEELRLSRPPLNTEEMFEYLQKHSDGVLLQGIGRQVLGKAYLNGKCLGEFVKPSIRSTLKKLYAEVHKKASRIS